MEAPRTQIGFINKKEPPNEPFVWLPDNQHLLTVTGDRVLLDSQDYNIIIWDAITGQEVKRFSLPNEAEPEAGKGIRVSIDQYATAGMAAFAPTNGQLATVGGDNTAVIWDAEFNAPVMVFHGHDNDVNAFYWSPDGRYLIQGGIIWGVNWGSPPLGCCWVK